MPALPAPRLSPEEYLIQERRADRKSEYLNGEVFTMAGASRRHNLIVVNLTATLHGRLRGRSCEVYSSDMRIHVPATGLFAYPDLAVVCEPARFHDDQFDTLLNPCLIIEVLSEHTKDYDRGTKFTNFRSIGTLAEYLLFDQDRLHGELYRRHQGQWNLTTSEDPGGSFELESVGVSLLLSEVYDRVPIDWPFSNEAERAVLASVLLSPKVLEDVAARLVPEDFYHPQHRMLFTAMQELSEAGSPLDAAALAESMGLPDPSFLQSLDLDLPDLGQLDRHIQVVEQWSRERRKRSKIGLTTE